MTTATINDIYRVGIDLAKALDTMKQTGFIITFGEDIYELCRQALEAASEILPGNALSNVLQIAESMTGTKDGVAFELYLRDADLNLEQTLRDEYCAHALKGAC